MCRARRSSSCAIIVRADCCIRCRAPCKMNRQYRRFRRLRGGSNGRRQRRWPTMRSRFSFAISSVGCAACLMEAFFGQRASERAARGRTDVFRSLRQLGECVASVTGFVCRLVCSVHTLKHHHKGHRLRHDPTRTQRQASQNTAHILVHAHTNGRTAQNGGRRDAGLCTNSLHAHFFTFFSKNRLMSGFITFSLSAGPRACEASWHINASMPVVSYTVSNGLTLRKK